MSYDSPFPDFELSLATLAQQDWMPIDKAFELLHLYRLVYFPVQDSRNAAAAYIMRINESTRPFVYTSTRQTRFAEGYWVNFSNATLRGVISLLQTALQYKDRMFEKSNSGNFTVSNSSNTPQYLLAFSSYNNGLRLLISALADPVNIWDRQRFEIDNSLTWA